MFQRQASVEISFERRKGCTVYDMQSKALHSHLQVKEQAKLRKPIFVLSYLFTLNNLIEDR